MAKRVVAPFVGAWIETKMRLNYYEFNWVAPFVGAWIETRKNGIKSRLQLVAPFVGAWIETYSQVGIFDEYIGRSLRGSVD